ncbi:NAD-binding protein [Halorubrum sp. CBA1125]|uniref:NAD(P)-dependent oxidoreductase n=1 Tax=Halorubrum sp. CBA1125 TaxID=2668072 RepID=UPI0012E7C62F|nr:NAD(P)-dependent oxidoreductase [Halorubrum sp. CBA1125]MUW13986.1 NAD-binding protein [Halorubrum sp. CBA1125]
MTTIGLIGVGYIGKLFLDALVDTDHDVTVFDIDPEKVQHAVDEGATAKGSPAEIGRGADAILMAVPGTPEVEDVMEGDDGLLDVLEEGQLVIDVSTTRPETSVRYEEKCADRGARFIEAPITGGSPREGYHMMIGGTEENYAAASDVLDIVCADHARVGEIGKGTIFKLGLQMRYAGHHAIDAEIVEFARDNGVDPALYNDFLEMGMLDKYFSEDFSQDIEGLGALAIWNKDIGYAREVAHENHTALPINGVVHEAYKATVRRADEDEGHAATLIKYWKLLNDAEHRD